MPTDVNYFTLACGGPTPLTMTSIASENSVVSFSGPLDGSGHFALNRGVKGDAASAVGLLSGLFLLLQPQVNQFRRGTRKPGSTPVLILGFVFIFYVPAK